MKYPHKLVAREHLCRHLFLFGGKNAFISFRISVRLPVFSPTYGDTLFLNFLPHPKLFQSCLPSTAQSDQIKLGNVGIPHIRIIGMRRRLQPIIKLNFFLSIFVLLGQHDGSEQPRRSTSTDNRINSFFRLELL